MDEIGKKLAGLGLTGIIIVIITATSGGNSAAAAAAAHTAVGEPFGIVASIALLVGLITVLGDVIAESGIEAIFKAVYTERSKTESVRFLLKDIKDLPITEELKLKLKNELSPVIITETQKVEIPKTVEFVEEYFGNIFCYLVSNYC